MNMDRSQKNLEKKKDDRTIEYLELKYDTNIQRGLTLAKVRQKQRGKRSSRNSITDLVYVFKTGVPESAFLFLSIFMCGKCFVSI